MSFLNLGLPLVLLGVAGLALGFYLLQRLRVRHRQVPVVTTLFWQEAVEESRARVLTKQFRHPWAYALILLIGSLLWIGLAGPESSGEGEEAHLVILDGSARMARGDLFARAKAAAIAEADGLPRDRRIVVLAGATPQRLLAPGEDILLLEKRLEGVTPDAAPSTLDDVITASAASGSPLRIITDARVWRPAAINADRKDMLVVSVEGGAGGNGGIVALGISDAKSGRYDAVDVFVEVAGARAGRPALAIDPAPANAPSAEEQRLSETRFQVWYRDVPARGQVVRATRQGDDALALDDSAAITLPVRRLHRVAIEPVLAGALGPVVAADPAFVADAASPDVRVVRGANADGPALCFVPDADGVPMIRIIDPAAEVDAEGVLARAYAELGLAEIDAIALADEAGRPVEVRVDAGPVPRIELWASLTTERYDLVHTRTFPALLSRCLRHLAKVPPLHASAAAGEPLAGVLRAKDAGGRDLDALGAEITPAAAGAYTTEDGSVHVSLAAPELTAAAPTGALPVATADAASGGAAAWTWLFLLAFLLLLTEWFLFRTERIP